ncbi:hypothetical protein GCM10022287_03420 [Gryllotalpicola koreensis]|uniref:Glycosyltransferase RgtA/B/C/D-like domain-containing protein n=1 Tax=Gryllotalpicola koreensis TaxID=993086 RepID=A0ABP7ZR21_9MICO
MGYAVINATAALPANPQLWWQLRQGELTLSTGHAVLSHSWSWTAGMLPWIPNSWGWGTLLAIAYRGAGFAGVVVFVLLAQLGVLALVWRVLGRFGLQAGPVRVGILVLFSLTLAGWADGQSELADYGAVFAFALVCLHPRMSALSEGRRRLALGGAAFAIAAVWENLHLGGLVAIAVFAAVYAICMPVARRASTAAVVGLGAALGVLATPAGAAGIVKSLGTASSSRAEHYAAWGHLFADPGGYNYEPVVLALVIGAAAIVLVLIRRDHVAAGILLIAALSACLVVRSDTDLVMLSVLAGGPAVARMPQPRLPRIGIGAFGAAAAWAIVAVCVAAASVVPGWRLTGVDPADLASIPHGARVFSTVGASDAIDVLRPDLQVTIDSRNDLYPVAQFEFAKSLTGAGAGAAQAPDYFEDNGVTAVYLQGAPAHEERTRLAAVLADAGWRAVPGVRGLVLLAPQK